MRINLKLLVVFLEITLIPLIILGFVAYSGAEKEITSQIISKLEALADIQKSRFENANKENAERLTLLTGNLQLNEETDKYNKTPNRESQEKIQKILIEAIKGLPSFKEVSIASLNGDIISSTNPKSIGLNLSKYEYFQKGKNANSVTNFSKDRNGIISLNIAGPLILDNKTIGVLVVNSDGSNIATIVFNNTGLGETGETLLATKDSNGDTLFLTPVRFDPNAALFRIVPKDKINIPSTHAVNGEEKIMLEAADYNNIPVIAVTRYIPEAKWGIVAKISQNEVYGPINKLRNLLIFMGIISAVIITFISFSVAKSFTDPISKLADTARKISSGDLSQRITVNSKDEIGALAEVFNEMTSKLQVNYRDLEMKVFDRTRQLTTKVNELEDAKKATLNLLEDLEEAKVKDEALVRDLEKFKLAMDNTSESIVIADPEGIMIYGNKAIERTTGYKPEEAIGKKSGVLWKTPMPPAYYQKMWDTIKKQKKVFIGEIQNKRKNGEVYAAAISISPIFDKTGEIIYFVGIERDITKEKDVDRAKTEFVSLASHQLRTPLSTVNWYAEMLLAGDVGKVTPKQREYLDEVYRSNQRMVALVNALLNVSRLELGTFVVEPKPTYIVKLARSVIDEQKPQIDEKRLQFIPSFEKNIPLIQADPKLLRMVVQNLLSNAVKYTPEKGKIELSLALDNEKKAVLLKISDTGYGIPKNQQDKIFTKLFRADNVREMDTEGTGLGLYIVKSIVEHSGGKIWFTSPSSAKATASKEENKGTTFYVTLPFENMKKKEGTKSLLVS